MQVYYINLLTPISLMAYKYIIIDIDKDKKNMSYLNIVAD